MFYLRWAEHNFSKRKIQTCNQRVYIVGRKFIGGGYQFVNIKLQVTHEKAWTKVTVIKQDSHTFQIQSNVHSRLRLEIDMLAFRTSKPHIQEWPQSSLDAQAH